MAGELGLDPSQITDIQANWSSVGPVEISFEGKIFMPLDDFRKLMDLLRGELGTDAENQKR